MTSPASASPQEMGELSIEDFKESKNPPAGVKVHSPYADRAYPDQVLWGDTHLHTNLIVKILELSLLGKT